MKSYSDSVQKVQVTKFVFFNRLNFTNVTVLSFYVEESALTSPTLLELLMLSERWEIEFQN